MSVEMAWHYRQEIISSTDPCVTLQDRGFRYGLHLFETVRTRPFSQGGLLFPTEHLQLLAKRAEKQRFPFTPSQQKALQEFIKTANFDHGILRLYLTAGKGAPSEPIRETELFLYWEPSLPPFLNQLTEGITAVTLPHYKTSNDWGEKGGQYATHFWARQEALLQGAEEGLCFDQNGFLLSASMANILLWKKNQQGALELLTPSSQLKRRAGITLSWVKSKKPLQEAFLTQDDLKEALSLALTNSNIGVMPLSHLDGRKLSISASIELAQAYHQNHF